MDTKINTQIVKINEFENENLKNNLDLQNCANILLNDGIGAFPTETVYGLGGNGLSPIAVKKIYEAKGRPSDNPLILHISDLEMLDQIAKNINENSLKLIDKFWPGPLTLIFEKTNLIPYETSGGLETVAVRFPKNKIAQELIRLTKNPIAAPSANISGKPSPTRFSHVEFDLLNKVNFIIDGGNTDFGLESTILDCTKKIPTILRPGSITKKMIEDVLGEVILDKALLKNEEVIKPLAPGMKYKHYSPEADVILVKSLDNIKSINDLILENPNKKIGILCKKENLGFFDAKKYIVQALDDNSLYHTLRKFDFLNVDLVFAEFLEETDENLALMNRLKKSANNNIITI